MAISNCNYVCPDCRTSSRIGSPCNICRRPMIGIGKRWRVPKRRDDKEWKIVKEKFERFRLQG